MYTLADNCCCFKIIIFLIIKKKEKFQILIDKNFMICNQGINIILYTYTVRFILICYKDFFSHP